MPSYVQSTQHQLAELISHLLSSNRRHLKGLIESCVPDVSASQLIGHSHSQHITQYVFSTLRDLSVPYCNPS